MSSPEEAYELAYVLRTLEAPVKIDQGFSVEPSLGTDSILSGMKASLIGTSLVLVFMLVYSLFAGLVANVALLLNIIILLGVMCSIDTTLTLPGIAVIVLTIGMAVDANVLIFERIREERAAGKSIRGAVAAGYDKAFGTIFDSNLTTLISAVILIWLGAGPVKGFGVSLTIGIAVSMFTALWSRLIFDWLLAKQAKSIRCSSSSRRRTSISCDGRRLRSCHFFSSRSALDQASIEAGNLGVDFSGGDRLTFSLPRSSIGAGAAGREQAGSASRS